MPGQHPHEVEVVHEAVQLAGRRLVTEARAILEDGRALQELRTEGTTIVIVTHDLQLVAEHASHVVVLAGGRVRASGPTSTLFRDERLLADAGLRLPALQRVLSSAGLGVHP